MTVKRGFRTSEVAKLTGLTLRQLDYWDRTGFIKPSLAEAQGRGSGRFYSFTDVVRLKVAKELRDAGVSLQALRRVIARLGDYVGLDDPLVSNRLVVSGDDVLLIRDHNELVSLLRNPGQGALYIVLDLERVVNALSISIDRTSKLGEERAVKLA